jgi:uncharacterized membrane protein (DUF4010 family)
MTFTILTLISPDALKIFLVVFLSFTIGLEREEQRSIEGKYIFGGVRTYPLIGLLGYGMALISPKEPIPVAAGLIVVGSLMLLSYWNKTRSSQEAGLTSEIAGLNTYLVGALVYYDRFWIASTIAIVSLTLLELKTFLEGLAHRFAPEDILTFTKFLFLTIVILPILPDREFSPFHLNPFKTWLVVVAVSSVSYGSFLLQKVLKGRNSIALTALLGGAYSSTVTTVALAKQSKGDRRPHTYSGAILIASGVMYLRLALLIFLFNSSLAERLILPFGLLFAIAVVGGWWWSSQTDLCREDSCGKTITEAGNPLELTAAFLFALLFVLISIATHYTVSYLGNTGIYVLAAIMGITDVDPFILGITQSAGTTTSLSVAAKAIAIATASNNLVKGLYAITFSDRDTGKQSFYLLLALSILGLSTLLFLKPS